MNMHETMTSPQEESARARRPRRLSPLAIVVLVVVGAVIAGAAFLFLSRDADPAAAPTSAGADAASSAPVISIVQAAARPVTADVRVTGSIAATRDLPVGVQGQGGMVMAVLVEEGDYVREGQVLARLDKRVQEQQVVQLRASVEQARADLQLAENELERARQLVDRGFISQADIDRREATRDAARARVNVAIAQVREAEARLAQLDVHAPEGGLILERTVEEGQVVGPGTGSLFRIAEDGQMELRAEVAEQDLVQLEPGQGAAIRIVGSDNVYRGTVSLVEPLIDPTSRQGTARIAIAEDRQVRPGAFATATVETGSANRPVLPESAVLGDVGNSYVYVLDAENRVQRQAVSVGAVGSEGVVIESGLNGSERVVESAGAFLHEGDLVAPAPADDAPQG